MGIMLDFLGGLVFMYVFAMPLLYALVSPETSEEQQATLRFMLLWPVAVVALAVDIIIGGDDDNGVGPS